MLSLNEYFQQGGSRSSYKQDRTKQEEVEISKISPIFFVFKYQSWTIQPSIHSAAQAYDRRPGFEEDDWKSLHRKVVKHLNQERMKKNGDYLFYSKSMQQGYVCMVSYSNKMIKLITVIPKGRSRPKDRTTKVVVENKDIELVDTIDLE